MWVGTLAKSNENRVGGGAGGFNGIARILPVEKGTFLVVEFFFTLIDLNPA